jgi:2-methylcitrate dehydratase PrpD
MNYIPHPQHFPVTAALATFVADTTLGAVSEDAILGAKRSLVDAIGVALAGSREPGPKLIAKYVRQLDAAAHSSVIGSGFKSAPGLAAWVNGTSADVLGWATSRSCT